MFGGSCSRCVMYKSLQTRLEGKLGVYATAALPLAAKKVENTGIRNAEEAGGLRAP